jgi:hypothetical protein
MDEEATIMGPEGEQLEFVQALGPGKADLQGGVGHAQSNAGEGLGACQGCRLRR